MLETQHSRNEKRDIWGKQSIDRYDQGCLLPEISGQQLVFASKNI